MSSSEQYQVVGECAHVTVDGPMGRTRTLLYKGAVFGPEVPEVEHLLSTGLVRRVDNGQVSGGVDAAGVPDGTTDTPGAFPGPDAALGLPAPVDAEREPKRAAAAAKLPTDGSPPKHNNGEDVWVEYAVRQGMDRGEAERAGKAELMRRYKDTSRAKSAEEPKPTDGEDAELQSLRAKAVEQGMDKDEVNKASVEDLRGLVK